MKFGCIAFKLSLFHPALGTRNEEIRCSTLSLVYNSFRGATLTNELAQASQGLNLWDIVSYLAHISAASNLKSVRITFAT